MKIDRYFPEIRPPSGGLQRLQARLDRRSVTDRRWVGLAAGGLTAAILLAVAGGILMEERQEKRQLQSLRALIAEQESPKLLIDGRPPAIEIVRNDRLEAYFAEIEG